MRRVAWPIVALGLLGAVLLSRCFSPDLPDCSFRCGQVDPACPEEYECRDDRYCHRLGTQTMCPFSMDLAPPPDLSTDGGADADSDGAMD